MGDNDYEQERVFHDAWALDTPANQVDVHGAWSELAAPENRWIEAQLGDVRNLRVLDLGCGLGEASVFLALKGAEVTAIDISPEMLRKAKEVATLHGVEIQTVQASSTNLSAFSDNYFDVVYGANMLHHVEIQQCIREVHRVLKSGGQAAFWDPLAYNPAIKIYRLLASQVRTDDEHPLTRTDVRTIRATFPRVKQSFFWFTATLIFVRFFFLDRLSPSENRYWKLVIDRQEQHRRFLQTTHLVDRFLLRICPPLKWWCWNTAIICEKS